MEELNISGHESTSTEHAAKRCLEARGYGVLKNIVCRFRRGTMTLKGTVPKYYHKQLAQEAVRRLWNVEIIVNEIRVSAKSRTAVRAPELLPSMLQ
jgi:hypothetical protein